MADQTLAVSRAIGMASLGFGALATVVAPGAFRQAYGDPTAARGSLDYFGRTWGIRTTALGVLTLMAFSDAERKRIAIVMAAMNAVDSLTAFQAQDVPTRRKTLAALTTAPLRWRRASSQLPADHYQGGVVAPTLR